ncbi:carboxymuconolactone decarboxylase family protein [Roseovarius sp. Pro17]|uniref:carboxymuconolactone decarboxylase family protein n=1 Tax=Roseovarius sp. Pro17 TaxID=3108175 RepID=UPI002D795DDE|nr:carboxymuconolactone decarboxylase family protein [Roseovarius sp. Pro17]
MTQSPFVPLSDAEWPTQISDLRDDFAGALNVYRTMAHHPDLLRAWAPLRQHIVKDNQLGPIRTEVVILRTAVRLGSEYEWAHHVSRSRALDMDDARIAAIREMPDGEDGLIVRAVDALIDNRHLTLEQEAELAAIIGGKAVIDLIATVGFYSILGYLLLTYQTPLDARIDAEMMRNPLSL